MNFLGNRVLIDMAYEERMIDSNVTSEDSVRKVFSVVRHENYESRNNDTEEWVKREFSTSVEGVLYETDDKFNYVKVENDLFVDHSNIDMFIQLLQDIKAADVLKDPSRE